MTSFPQIGTQSRITCQPLKIKGLEETKERGYIKFSVVLPKISGFIREQKSVAAIDDSSHIFYPVQRKK